MNKLFASASLIASLAALSVPAAAATYSERNTVYQITFPTGLDSATSQYDNMITMPAGGSSVIGGTLSLKLAAYNEYFNGTGGVTTTYTPQPPGTASEVGDIVNDGTGGMFNFGYVTNNGPDLASSWTDSEIAGGHHVVHFLGGGTNLCDVGCIYTVEIFLQGDWSTAGTAPGDHQLNSIASGFSVVDNFSYSAGTNETTLSVSSGSFPGGSPNIDFYLFGPGVPEPATWSMMILGVFGVGAALRRRTPALTAA